MSEVRSTPDTTQRGLANRLGISLGLTNLLLRNLARKGHVRVAKANWRRRLYALTPSGIVRRALLTAAYVGRFLNQYQSVKLILREELEPLALHAESTVAIYGTGEFAELVYLALREFNTEEVDIFGQENVAESKFLGMVVRHVDTLKPGDYDRVVVAELKGAQSICSQLRARGVTPDQLVTFFGNAPQESIEEAMGNIKTQRDELP